MGQEVVYCFKCQKRIHGTEFAKGQAYQVENNFCCSSCAVGVLETLPPKAKEQLLAKMFKATQERQSTSSPSLKAAGNAPPPPSTTRIPRPVRTPGTSSSGPLIAGIVGVIVVVVLMAVVLSSGSSSPPPPPPTATPRPAPPRIVDPGPTPEEKRRVESAKDALQKARDFAQANPKDLEGQVRIWRAAAVEAERTGYEAEARREAEKAENRAKESAAQQLADLERDVRALIVKKDYKGAADLLDRAQPLRATAEWSARIGTLRREAEPPLPAELPWKPLFDGRTLNFLVTEDLKCWRVVDGCATRDVTLPDTAAQTKQDFGDGEFRFRFTFNGASGIWFAVRQAEGGQTRIHLPRPVLETMNAGPHEVLLTCRGTQITGTLDGMPFPVTVQGKVLPRGRIQFNFSHGSFKLLSLEMRDLP